MWLSVARVKGLFLVDWLSAHSLWTVTFWKHLDLRGLIRRNTGDSCCRQFESHRRSKPKENTAWHLYVFWFDDSFLNCETHRNSKKSHPVNFSSPNLKCNSCNLSEGCRDSLQYRKYLEVVNFFTEVLPFFKKKVITGFPTFPFSFLILLSSTICFTLSRYLNTLLRLPFPIGIFVPHFLPELRV